MKSKQRSITKLTIKGPRFTGMPLIMECVLFQLQNLKQPHTVYTTDWCGRLYLQFLLSIAEAKINKHQTCSKRKSLTNAIWCLRKYQLYY